ncbi:hypothetical protein GCM10009841_04000 [Microlunatus panaciterrae]|uniref:Alpha-tubulin suppressor n=1 Tax=Microlunatus panaciterrae TaxID=400768 RepID=A0ABS2RIW1_9ACTN|nr:hypothetical protein [Microlunatus panaciterrae]MBM7798940.1 hypothetical protein [Microlunatus panaciterrae]
MFAALLPSLSSAEVVLPLPDVKPGRVVTWGGGADRQELLKPPADLDDAVAVTASDSAGSYSSLALRADGTLVGWGLNAFGETTPPEDLTGVVSIDSGPGFSLALRADGSVVAWGSDVSGQTDVPDDLGPVTAVSAGGYFSYQGIGLDDQPCGFALALRQDGTVVRWGKDSPQLGCDFIDARLNPPDGLAHVVAISAGSRQALALRSDGTVVAWGSGVAAGLDGTPPEQWSNIVAISAGSGNSLGLRADGTVLAYGIWGESGPPQVTDVAAVSASNRDVFLHRDRTVTVYPELRESVPQGDGYQSVSAGFDYALAIQAEEGLPTEPVIGSAVVQPWVDANPAGTAEAFQYVATGSGTVTTFRAYLDDASTAERLVVGVYDDEGGEPGALLATGRSSELKAGDWNSISLGAGTEITAGQPYWLALLAPLCSGTIRFRDLPEGEGGPTRLGFGDDVALPSHWRSSRDFTNSPASIYLN